MDIGRDFKKLFIGGPEGTYVIKLENDPEIESHHSSKLLYSFFNKSIEQFKLVFFNSLPNLPLSSNPTKIHLINNLDICPQEIKVLPNNNLLIFNTKTTCLEYYDP